MYGGCPFSAGFRLFFPTETTGKVTFWFSDSDFFVGKDSQASKWPASGFFLGFAFRVIVYCWPY